MRGGAGNAANGNRPILAVRANREPDAEDTRPRAIQTCRSPAAAVRIDSTNPHPPAAQACGESPMELATTVET